MGRPFGENFLILVKCPRDSRKKSDWFRHKKISQKLKYLNFKCDQSERYFFVLFFLLHHSEHIPCEKLRWRQAKRVSGHQAIMSVREHRLIILTTQGKNAVKQSTLLCNENATTSPSSNIIQRKDKPLLQAKVIDLKGV